MKSASVVFVLAAALLVAADSVPDLPVEFRADPEATRAAAARATTERFPDADCVLIDDRIHTRFESDGSYIIWDDEWEKALTEKGRRALSSVSLDYNARYGDAGILCLEIVGTNGQTRAVDFARAQKIATDNSAMAMNIVDPLNRKLSCFVPDLKVGEIRHVRFWKRMCKARMRDAWADVALLEQTQPILSTVVSIDQTPGRPIVHAALRNPVSNTVVRAANAPLPGGRTLLKWTARDVPQAFPEPNMPPFSRCAQTLRFSTVKDWPTVSRWYWNLCEPHLAKTTPAMTNAVDELVRECPDEPAKIRALFKFVSQEVRYMGLTLEDDAPGYEPHDVAITFDNRYGVCRDKAALLAALLRIAGMKAYPVLIHAGAKMDAEVPTPFFNHAIVGVECSPRSATDAPYLLMDPTDESTKDLLPAYLSDKSYLVARPEGEALLTSPVVPAAANTLRVGTEGTLDANGDALLTTSFVFNGINDTAVRHIFLKKMPEQRRRWFEGVWRDSAAGAELLSMEIQPLDLRDTDAKLTVKTVARLPELLRRGRTRDELKLPFATRALSVVNGILDENTLLERRRFPLTLPCTAGTEETIRLTLGDSVGAVLSLPADARVSSPAYSFTRAVACSNGVLTARRALCVDNVNFDVPAYDALRNARKEVETAERESPLFSAQRNVDANTRIREHSTVMHFTSPTAWVATNVVEKEVLTYRGKQTTSELKFPYAPSTRHIELVSATVSNSNGRVFSITPKEINLMDCDWAASAPRYPASKILVANLPGVEIGSVVRYVVARTVTNAPVAHTLCHPFGACDPVDRERMEIHVPAALDFRFSADHVPARAASVTTNAGERVYVWEMRNPPREPEESSLPPIVLWRPCLTTSLVDWRSFAASLVGALAAARGEGTPWVPWSGDATRAAVARVRGRALTARCPTAAARITAIRTFLRRLGVAGPGLFELPFDQAFTAPDRVLAEGYASRADWMNLLRVMLEAAGFDCSFVLVANDAQGFRGTEAAWRAVPRPALFNTLVIRAVWREGWLPGLRRETEFWLSAENEYTPPEASARFGDSYFDPQRCAFGRIAATSPQWVSREENVCRMEVRVNGVVDFDVTNRTFGASVGGLRKRFAELLPEARSRFHQKVLGALAQNATATGELETDTEGYPFSLSYRAYAEGYAVARADGLTVKIPDFVGKVFGVGGERRRAPIAVTGKNEVVDTYEVVFPEGYTEIEYLPESFEIRNPLDADDVWLRHDVSSRVVEGRLHVIVRRRVRRARATLLGADYHPFLHDWNRRAASAAARTLSVRRTK